MAGINSLDIKQLRVLHLLLIEKSTSRVAPRMGISQQAVSEQLKKLRDTFDDPLFTRKSNGLIPTPFALSLQQEVAEIIHRLENIVAPKVFEPQKIDTVFRICATDYAQAVVLPSLLALIRQQAPKLKVIVQDIEIDNLSTLMDNGEIDLVISFPAFVPAKYPTQTLFSETHHCVINEHHPKARQRWSIEEIANHPQLIISPKRANLVGSADDYFASFGLKRNIVMSLPFFSASAECIKATDLLALLPTKLLPTNLLPIKGLKKIDSDIELPHFDVIIAWHQRANKDALNIWVRNLLAGISF